MESSALHDRLWLETVSYTSKWRSKMQILILPQKGRSNPKYVSLNYVSPRRSKSCYFYWPEVKKGGKKTCCCFEDEESILLKVRKAVCSHNCLFRKLLEIYVLIYWSTKINLMSCLHWKLSQLFIWKSVLPSTHGSSEVGSHDGELIWTPQPPQSFLSIAPSGRDFLYPVSKPGLPHKLLPPPHEEQAK